MKFSIYVFLSCVTVSTAFPKIPNIFDAAARGNVHAIQRHLTRGMDPNVQEVNGWTPLALAAHYGHQNVCGLLLQAGADPNRSNSGGWAPLHHVVQNDFQEITQLLLEEGADPNIASNNGWTPLHVAARNNLTSMVSLLISWGARPDIVNDALETPLHHLAFAGKENDLFEQPGDISKQNQGHWSVLHIAAKHDNAAFIKEVFMKYPSFNPNIAHPDGWTPLHCAAKRNNVRAIEAMLAFGADPNNQNNIYRKTPLHDCAYYNCLDAARALINGGAKLYLKDKYGDTALHRAAGHGHTEMVKLLLAHGAPVITTNRANKTPFLLAMKDGFAELGRLLCTAQKERATKM